MLDDTPTKLETMTTLLRASVPSSSSRALALEAALGASRPAPRPRSRRALSLVAAGGAATVAALAFVLRPQPALARGLTWAQIAKATAGAGPRHGVTTEPRGVFRTEFWRDGRRYARVDEIRIPAGRRRDGRPHPAEFLYFEYRTDGVRAFNLEFGGEPTPKRPNARRRGTLSTGWTSDRDTGHDFPGGMIALDDLVASKKATILGERPVGDRREVRIHFTDPFLGRRPSDATLVVDARGRIVEARGISGGVTRYDYPASLPGRVFEPRPQVLPAEVVDRKATRARVAAGVAKGLGTDRGVTLRAVLLDASGDLYVASSGAVPPASSPRRVRVVGVPTSWPSGLRPFTVRATPPGLAGGLRLRGAAVTPLRAIGERISLRVPAARGEAAFRDVPVTRVVSFSDYRVELGLPGR